MPVDHVGYRPQHYFGNNNGNVTIEKQLATSLNVPAVKVLDQLGMCTFVQKLHQARFSEMKRKGYQLGLLLILRGCDVKLEEIHCCIQHLPTRASTAPSADYSRIRPGRKRSCYHPHLLTW